MYLKAGYVVVLQVFFLDFGNTAAVACSSLRELPSDLLSHQFQVGWINAHLTRSVQTVNKQQHTLCSWSQAQEFEVTGMLPSSQSIILGNQWSSQARNRFIMLVKGHSLIMSLYSILHGVMRVEVLINTETTNTSVVDILVEEGHAVKAEEGFNSKVT